MPWPQAPDYAEAIQNLKVCFRDPVIQSGQVEVNRFGQPKAWSGNFATVFQVRASTGRHWAVKCFTREVPALQARYREIDAHLRRQRLPFMARFEYVPAGVLVRGQWCPFLRMDWVEGQSLDGFVQESIQKGTYEASLRLLTEMWLRLAQRLRESGVAHGDLQHGNVMLVPVPEKKSYLLKLIDYDGMFVPELSGNPPPEVGHDAYQHPERRREGGYGPEIDQFSHLVVCTTLHCLQAGGHALWDKYYSGDNLLFARADFEQPERSPLFHELWNLPEGPARNLVGHLLLAAKGRLEDVPRLEDLIVKLGVTLGATPLTPGQVRQVEEILSRGAGTIRRAPQPPPLPPISFYPSSVQGLASPAESIPPRPLNAALDPRGWPNVMTVRAELPPTKPRSQPPNASVEANSIRMQMVLVPAGEFVMGSSDGATYGKPHFVRISQPYYLGQFEVTLAQFHRFVEESKYDAGTAWRYAMLDSTVTGDEPVVNVSWNDATAFCEWLSFREGETHRLPTEAEWEYACRAGTTTKYSFGDDAKDLDDYAWSIRNSGRRTHPVGRKRPNVWGLYDMHGNGWEWCADWFESNYYESSPADDPVGPSFGTYRVVRGGSCSSIARLTRSAYRLWDLPDNRDHFRGFRVARNP